MPHTWTNSLSAYRYPFDLRRFEGAGQYPNWFEFYSDVGDRTATMELENHFRQSAPEAVEPWLEVVYWKMFSQPEGRGNKATLRIAKHLEKQNISPRSLWNACNRYLQWPTRDTLDIIRNLLGLTTSGVAFVSTFIAFIDPPRYPMVDTRVAKWVRECMLCHNAIDPFGPQLIQPHFPAGGSTVLTIRDFSFVQAWITWCRHTAHKLRLNGDFEWRARDVEMAVFHAWGGRRDPHPKLTLNPLQPPA